MPIPFARILAKIFFERFFHAFVSCGRWTFFLGGAPRLLQPSRRAMLGTVSRDGNRAALLPTHLLRICVGALKRHAPCAVSKLANGQSHTVALPRKHLLAPYTGRAILVRLSQSRCARQLPHGRSQGNGDWRWARRRRRQCRSRRRAIKKQLRAEARSCHQNRRSKVRGTQELCWGVSGGV